MEKDYKYQYPRVGVCVVVIKDGEVLLGKRMGSHGEGEYGFPGGHLEYMESISECATREVKEETGIEIINIRFLRLLNMKIYAPKHYIDIGLLADWKSGKPEILEPDKCAGWAWYGLENLPNPLFGPVPTAIKAYKTGRNFWDA